MPKKKMPPKITDAMVFNAGQSLIPSTRLPLTLPALPPGVVPKGEKRMAMDDSLNMPWAWSNSMQGGPGCGLYFPGYPYLAELQQRAEYRSPVETIAEEMTRKWMKFTSASDHDVSDKIKQLETAFTEFGIQDRFRRASELDGYFGMAKIFVKLKGDRDARETPLLDEPETIAKGSLEGFKVIEPMWITPRDWNSTDPTEDDFYKPTVWYVMGKPTHDSRLINFVSREVPDLLKPSYNFGGISLSQLMEAYVNEWLRAKKSIADLIRNFSIIALATDMQALLAEDNGQNLSNRIAMFIKNRDNKGLMTLNKESEELSQIAVPLSGLDALQAQAQEHMCAVSRLPLVKAFGITPSGLNASSEEEIMVFDDHIHARQEIQYTGPLTRISRIVQLHLFGEIDPDIGIEFVPLRELDGEALGRVRKGDAELASTLISAGVISPEEERGRLADDPNSGYTGLVVEDVPEPPDQEGEEENQGGGGDSDSD